MKALESWLFIYALNALWQVPLLFAAGWLAARSVRRSGPAMEYRIWTVTLVLEAVLPACTFQPAALLAALSQLGQRLFGVPAADGDIRIVFAPRIAAADGLLHLQPEVVAVVTLLYAASIVYFSARFLAGLRRIALLRSHAQAVAFGADSGLAWERCTQFFNVHDAHAAVSASVRSPVTVGVRHRIVILPATWHAAQPIEDFSAAVAHEFAHMHRHDFAKNLICEVLSLPIAFHPLLWLTRTRLSESREMICDSLAADAVAGRENYVRSLLRLAATLSQAAPPRTPHAIGIFDANIFERRIMNLTQHQLPLTRVRRFATVAVCMALGLAACSSALALRIHPAAPHAEAASTAAQDPGLKVSAGVMAANIHSRVNPVYPPDAKAAGIGGTVVLHAVIGKDGSIEKLDIVSGPEQFQASALEAVRQWTYKPFLVNGDPVEVETTVTVNYSLAHGK